MKKNLTGRGAFLVLALWQQTGTALTVDSGQNLCYDDSRRISCPAPGTDFYGQDAQYGGAAPAYRDNGDGTVLDLNTGLMWSKGLDGHKVTPEEAKRIAAKMSLGGYRDWRVPTIKELYSLIDFRGYTGFDGRRQFSRVPDNAVPFINTDYFDFAYGNVALGERYIDAQWLSSTHYVSTTMDGMKTVFGVNFADGRIKGYGYKKRGGTRIVKTFYARYVRGKPYGENDFIDNGNGTVTDRGNGRMWTKQDSGKKMNWQKALAYCETLDTASHGDWRLPNIKELQYIVDYRRSPDTTGSAAIAPLFETSAIINEAKQKDFPFFWSSTTHLDGPRPGKHAAYVAFGRAIGQMRGRVMDVHGAGAQRSDPKNGGADIGHAPQGDARRGENFVRCVRGGPAMPVNKIAITAKAEYPHKIRLVKVEDKSARRMPDRDRQLPRHNGPALQKPRDGFVSRLDRNGDNRVSRDEFDGPPDRFDDHDANRDGYLTDDEAPRLPLPNGRRPGW